MVAASGRSRPPKSLKIDTFGNTKGAFQLDANPPFEGSLDAAAVAKDLIRIVSTRKNELLFLALFLRLLKRSGRTAVVVPDGVLFGSNKAHNEVRHMLVEDQQLQGVVKLPAGVFRPYAGVSTAILLCSPTCGPVCL